MASGESVLEYDLLGLLSDLPIDVGRLIFDFLPNEMLGLFELSNEKPIRSFAAAVRVQVADFRDCCYIIPPEIIACYVTARSHCLQVLNIDNVAYASAKQLCTPIAMCKSLTSLSIRYCGLNLNNVCHILSELPNIANISWSLDKDHDSSAEKEWNVEGKQVKKVCLDVYKTNVLYDFLKMLESRLGGLEFLELNFCDFRDLMKYCFHHSKSDRWEQFLRLPNLRSLVITRPALTSCEPFVHSCRIYDLNLFSAYLKGILKDICMNRPESTPWERLWLPFWSEGMNIDMLPDGCGNLSSTTSFFMFKDLSDGDVFDEEDEEETLNELSDVLEERTQNSMETLGLFVSELREEDLRSIQIAGGRALKKLEAIYGGNYIRTDAGHFLPLFESCGNITVLNISGIHFKENSGVAICNAISLLHDLKELYIPECAGNDACLEMAAKQEKGPKASTSAEDESEPPTAFTIMVRCCKLVSVFHINGCDRCSYERPQSHYYENNLKYIYEWERLTYLRLNCVYSVRFCTFLVQVGSRCKQFKHLELVNVGPRGSCKYLLNLLFFLKTSKSLNFVRILDSDLDYTSERLWVSVSRAPNLHGLCIATEVKKNLDVNTVVDSLSKLRHFTCFHFYSHLDSCKGLENAVRTLIAKTTKKETTDVNVVMQDIGKYTYLNKKGIGEPACPYQLCAYKTQV